MTKFEKYAALQADFYQYMCIEGGISSKTASDYVTRLKFLSYDYPLDENITKERIEWILRQETIKQQNRNTYNSRKSLSDFRSALNKFLLFVQSDFRK